MGLSGDCGDDSSKSILSRDNRIGLRRLPEAADGAR